MQDQLLFLKVANMPIQNKGTERSYHFHGLLFSFWTSLAANDHISKNWPLVPYSRNGPDGCLYGKSPNRYTDEELFHTCFEEIWVAYIPQYYKVISGRKY